MSDQFKKPRDEFEDLEKKNAKAIRQYVKSGRCSFVTPRMTYLLEKYPEEEN